MPGSTPAAASWFEKEVTDLKPDYFFVNTDGYTPDKKAFCEKLGIELVVSERIPEAGLPARSTTALRQECRIPYRVELCGGWLDQPAVNSLCPGPVIVMSIEPTIEFNDKSGMATGTFTPSRSGQNNTMDTDELLMGSYPEDGKKQLQSICKKRGVAAILPRRGNMKYPFC